MTNTQILHDCLSAQQVETQAKRLNVIGYDTGTQAGHETTNHFMIAWVAWWIGKSLM